MGSAWHFECKSSGKKNFKQCIEVLRRIHGTALHAQFETFSWALENLIKRRGGASEAEPLLRNVFESLLTATEVAAAVISRAAGHAISVLQLPEKNTGNIMIKAGRRETALEYLSNWFANEAVDTLYICDPFFGRTELEAVQLAIDVKASMQNAHSD